jgi:Serine phosphatase RsbU, regulator of sigma subunit
VPLADDVPWRLGEDLLVLFTDGISDARNPAGERLGEEKVLRVIGANRSLEPEAILRQVFDMLGEHTGGAPGADDLTLLVMRA